MRYNFSMKQETLQSIAESLWLEYCEVFPALVKFDCPKIILNKRLIRTAGGCHTDDNYIVLGYKFLEQFEHNMLTVILPHELAHQIDYNLNGWEDRKLHHGPKWCAIMERIGCLPEPYHSMELKL